MIKYKLGKARFYDEKNDALYVTCIICLIIKSQLKPSRDYLLLESIMVLFWAIKNNVNYELFIGMQKDKLPNLPFWDVDESLSKACIYASLNKYLKPVAKGDSIAYKIEEKGESLIEVIEEGELFLDIRNMLAGIKKISNTLHKKEVGLF